MTEMEPSPAADEGLGTIEVKDSIVLIYPNSPASMSAH
jgi:hypothetical protein